MNTSTRLVLILTLAVGTVMLAASYILLRQREGALQTAVRGELRAHAATLRVVLEDFYREDRIAEAQRLIDHLHDNTSVYGFVLFDDAGQVVMLSNRQAAEIIAPPPELARVLRTSEASETTREIGAVPMLTLVSPLRVEGRVRGAFEIAQPLAFVEASVWRARFGWTLTTLALMLVIVLVVSVVLRRTLQRPIAELLNGATAIGRGDFSYRVRVPPAGDELVQLANGFNRMADRLSEQRAAADAAAAERLRLERDLRHSERLAAVGQLAAGVAHELGAPLNVIDGRAEQLLTRPDVSHEKSRRNLEIIRNQTARITHIVRQLLNLARPYDLHRVRLDLDAAMRDALDNLAGMMQDANVRVVFDFDENPINICADPDFLRQVLTNVLINAVQAMQGDGGTITVELQSDAAERGGVKFARVIVADCGSGISEEDLEHVFEPFFTTKDVGSGTGLGLTVSRRIVEEHGGWITAVNNTQKGATFMVYLPQLVATEHASPPRKLK